MNQTPSDPPPAPDPRKRALIGLGVILLLIVGGVLVAHELSSTARLQDCVLSGRSNCAPIGNPSSGDSSAN